MRIFDVCSPSEHPLMELSTASLSPPRVEAAQGSQHFLTGHGTSMGQCTAPAALPVFISAPRMNSKDRSNEQQAQE